MDYIIGMPIVIVGNCPYSGDEGTIAGTSNAEGYVKVRFPQYGRYGRTVEIRMDFVQDATVNGGVTPCN